MSTEGSRCMPTALAPERRDRSVPTRHEDAPADSGAPRGDRKIRRGPNTVRTSRTRYLIRAGVGRTGHGSDERGVLVEGCNQ